MPPERPVRRGQLISPYGIGQMINFPQDESLMICGLDVWESIYQNAPDGHNEFIIREERLENRLGVTHFRLPPDYREPGTGLHNPELKVPFIRFPRWHYCPRCGSMEKLSIYGSRQRCKGIHHLHGMSCHSLNERKRQYLIPVRFITVCCLGHIEDFPFMEWVHREKTFDDTHQLRLRAGRSSSALSGIMISCSCGTWNTMAVAFNERILASIGKKCSGSRPWLGEIDEKARGCEHDLRVVQRGATNVYFPLIRSSIYLPHWDKSLNRRLVEVLEENWDRLTRNRVDGKLDRNRFEVIAEIYGVDSEKLLAAAEKRLNESPVDIAQVDDSEESYRKSEYDAILCGLGGDNQDFYVTNEDINEYDSVLKNSFKSIALIHKLRETRAIAGFSRLLPEDGRTLVEKRRDLYLGTHIDWLPAIIAKGEGIFFEFDNNKLENWTQRKDISKRAILLIKNFNDARSKYGYPDRSLNSRFILLHTFSHVLINQFSFECGYGSSALRERIYCNTQLTDKPMNGVLIYTASGDSEGSLGGLVRQGKPGNLEDIVTASLNAAKWCSSDPVCMESKGQGPDSCNLAACHSCALLPETSCEEGNRLLDRALLIGTFERPEIGYFTGFDE